MKTPSFSLIELLITLALVVLLVAFTVPRTTFFARFIVQAEINKMYAICSYLQQRALAANDAQELQLDLTSNTYRFANLQGKQTTQRLHDQVRFGVLPQASGPPGKPTASLTNASTFPEENGVPCIQFMTNGKITSGTVYFIDRSKKCLGALTCAVSQVSYMRRYIYDNHQWVVW